MNITKSEISGGTRYSVSKDGFEVLFFVDEGKDEKPLLEKAKHILNEKSLHNRSI